MWTRLLTFQQRLKAAGCEDWPWNSNMSDSLLWFTPVVWFIRSRRREKHNTLFHILVLVWFLSVNMEENRPTGESLSSCIIRTNAKKHQTLTNVSDVFRKWSHRYERLAVIWLWWIDLRGRPEFKHKQHVEQPPVLMKLRRGPSQYLDIYL